MSLSEKAALSNRRNSGTEQSARVPCCRTIPESAHAHTQLLLSANSSGHPGWIKKLGPYQSLFLLLIPISLVEPMKLVALAVAGKGHWIAGTGMIVIAYVGSLFIVERLFRLVKPKLLKIYWFARLWAWFVIIREKTLSWFARFIPFYPLNEAGVAEKASRIGFPSSQDG
jgi:hypothetical protein